MNAKNLYYYKAKVDRVIDGDTVDVIFDLGFGISLANRVRLAEIDTPEMRTRDLKEKEAGLSAYVFTKAWLDSVNGDIFIETTLDKAGKYGRVIGKIFNANGDCLNDALLKFGHAEEY
jgi:micrococcal nuclease|tara:strand:+ start:4171 stop:4524 length:354 start_codon:yes stop_codon:yes gene_type:complete